MSQSFSMVSITAFRALDIRHPYRWLAAMSEEESGTALALCSLVCESIARNVNASKKGEKAVIGVIKLPRAPPAHSIRPGISQNPGFSIAFVRV